MFNFNMRFNLLMESINDNGLVKTINSVIHVKKEVIVVEKDLDSVSSTFNFINDSDSSFIEITQEKFNNYSYPVKSRYLKAIEYFNRGYKSLGIVKKNIIIGDIWYSTFNYSLNKFMHPNQKIELLQNLNKDDVYMFDMYVFPKERKNGIANSLMNTALLYLKEKGYKNAYGYYLASNIPALWVHRILKFKELERCYIKKIFFLIYSEVFSILKYKIILSLKLKENQIVVKNNTLKPKLR